ncbi:phosphate/phosphite/phosphonate ABC transporter substrate-binding protein [Thiohalomonas denitrificans]|uniref:ABC transporter, phosphonate, substrate-binding protein n=1 Tax=Thiohalomonas denitrificans TaxID=415747 RepID=A0A1G5QIW0_9GAMM|nr:PhnD/SsuA/transferrin family substrate-binding protein [Thiohalomonas denitrificans]SCZ61795.1 ABC transporter, phosphonate, substrate-binding protein [Thiohalomonas denitrificans]
MGHSSMDRLTSAVPGFRILTFLVLLTTGLPAMAAKLTFAVHPVLPAEQTRTAYQPLLRYLEKNTGHELELVVNSNFLVHWQMLRRGEYDIILDGPHFTDYRVQKMGYQVLAKFPAAVSYTLVGSPDSFILEPAELVGERIATTPSPALGALRLSQLYPNPLRQPQIVETGDSLTAARMTVEGETAGAIIPAGMVGNFPSLITVTTTTQVPSPAVSVGPDVDEIVANALRQALLDAGKHTDGLAALESLNIPTFEPAGNADYEGQAELLKDTWGY